MLLLIRGFFSLLIGTIVWHSADVGMLREFERGNIKQALAWMSLHVVSIPFFAFSAYSFFTYQRSWWIVELPYLLLSMGISAFLFGSVLHIDIGWREVLAGLFLVCGAYLLLGGQ